MRIVLAIAEAGSVTKAAAALGLAQPALTTQLQRIERILGGALFIRDRRGVLPTPLGDLVLARARVLIPAVSGLHDDASELITAGADARYRVGATNGPIVAGLVRRLSDAHPGGPVIDPLHHVRERGRPDGAGRPARLRRGGRVLHLGAGPPPG